jgi:hypothetical protein
MDISGELNGDLKGVCRLCLSLRSPINNTHRLYLRLSNQDVLLNNLSHVVYLAKGGFPLRKVLKNVPQATGSAHFSRHLNLVKAVFDTKMNYFESVLVLNIELISV